MAHIWQIYVCIDVGMLTCVSLLDGYKVICAELWINWLLKFNFIDNENLY